MMPPAYREFTFAVQITSDVSEVMNIIDQVLKSYPSVDVGLIGRFLVDLADHRP
jgi:hypothetical protein